MKEVPDDLVVFQRYGEDKPATQLQLTKAQLTARQQAAAATAAALTQADAKEGAEEWLLDIPAVPTKTSLPRLAYKGGVKDANLAGKKFEINYAMIRASQVHGSGVRLPMLLPTTSPKRRGAVPQGRRRDDEDEEHVVDKMGDLLAPKPKKAPPKAWEAYRRSD